ncbi:major facilitator superfamily MFS_1 [Thermosinus carboxydivorans Nor1]|uniref:Major facilitator superfamily MFS_1 n=1 Tax=Thermosinus carboxydivorans Nor1 TaxID=401526 RepID=A1HM48_9FIRM|nr:MFS transporter [Thermosinus carboxydivorans]EAX48898.1 major facilitator superfamily MFS_1 [Thermosinus carboxydivorans Nor1]
MGKNNKIFYGWWIVLVAFLSIAITYGTKGVFGVVQLQMLDDLHWTRASIAGALSANMMVYAIAAPFVGRIMDKVGIRTILILGALLTGAAFMLVTTVTSPVQFYIYYGLLLGLANTGMGMIPGPTAVNRWFIKKRGRALSIALVASPLGMAVFTFLAKDLLKTIGWKGLFVVMGVAAWVLVIIPAYLLMRSSPEEMGLKPDGETDQAPTSAFSGVSVAPAPSIAQEEEWTLTKLLLSPKAWCLLFGYFVLGGNGWAQQVHQVPHLMQMGLSKDSATVALGFNMTLAILSMLIWPSISDFMKRSTAVVISLVLQALGTFLLLNANTLTMTYAFVFIMGISHYGSYGLFTALAADTFGRRSLGTVSGVMAMVGAGGAALGIYAGGALYDAMGNYRLLWQCGIGALVLATLLIMVLGQMKQQADASVKTTA